MNKFPAESFKTLKYYVYRLIDPKNNRTFYIGKGSKNRVFNHINDELRFANNKDFAEDELSAKMQIIREIRREAEAKCLLSPFCPRNSTRYCKRSL